MGMLGKKHTEETKQQLRLSHIGRKLTEETKRKISLSNIGRKISEETRKKIGLGNKGKIMSKEAKRKISESHKGKKHSKETIMKMSLSKRGKKQSPETIKKRILSMKGRHHTEEARRKISLAHMGLHSKLKGIMRPEISGQKHPNWKGGITSNIRKIRNSLEYKLWRRAVCERDNWTCIWCGQRGGKLNTDHIKPFADYPELRFAIDNGRTLCIDCHKKTETYGGKSKRRAE